MFINNSPDCDGVLKDTASRTHDNVKKLPKGVELNVEVSIIKSSRL